MPLDPHRGRLEIKQAREHGGRTWRLADTCAACAAAPTQPPSPKCAHVRDCSAQITTNV
ncbi:hypothetical protein J7E87_32255 [Streptomyces sp. ISL-1]|uniref:hypothetical protein n=1 Tax=Streptomyces sp. ISL-1 TaxID=2817657 RepID=UPI001BE7BBA8|nr:hypothetical protein [Streptomyces sp. ISL-1]MBT2393959.1 hypothetical protein [Streptomyces sp. ISL-1]